MVIHGLHGRFCDPANLDRTVAAHTALDKVTGVMKENIGKMFVNRQAMFDIESKSGDIKDAASRFRIQS